MSYCYFLHLGIFIELFQKGKQLIVYQLNLLVFTQLYAFIFFITSAHKIQTPGQSPKRRNASDSLPIGVVSTGAC